jgi:hypothetical protein
MVRAPQGASGASGAAIGETLTMSRLPLLVALILVAAPNLIFLATHLVSPLLSMACIGAALAALFLVVRDLDRNRDAVDRPLLAICVGTAFVLCLLGGETHVFYANADWLVRDAVLSDLVNHAWPVGYTYEGDATFLRAPLGLYLVPASVGKALGLQAAHVALLLQNAVLFGCLFYCFASAFPTRRRALWVLAVFVAFSGWDIVGQVLLRGGPAFGQHLEQWLGELQYSSDVTQLFWVPNHAASGWAFVAAYLFWRRDRLSAASLIVVFGLCVFWSPLSMIGALPFLGVAVVTDIRRGEVTLRDIAQVTLAGLALVPIALFLIADSARVPHGALALKPAFILEYVPFLTIEIVPSLILLRLFRPVPIGSFLRRDLPVVILVLLLCPLFKIGGNDFVMRASIPALAILAFCVADRTWFVLMERQRWPIVEALIFLAIGAVTPLYEIARAIITPPYAISDCNLMTASSFPPNDGPMVHYVARVDASQPLDRILKMPTYALRAEARTVCWPAR